MPEVALPQQIDRPQLQGHLVQHTDAFHLIIIDSIIVPCTPSEYDLLMPLLYDVGEPVSFTCLLSKHGQHILIRGIRRGLTQQMSRLRSRL
jgi:hypothetical protein